MQLAQDDDGFEIRSFGNSLDEEDAFDAPDGRAAGNLERELSPAPPKPVAPAPKHRESLDGETIFAVGEEGDKWSDDDDESPRNSIGERRRLTEGKKTS